MNSFIGVMIIIGLIITAVDNYELRRQLNKHDRTIRLLVKLEALKANDLRNKIGGDTE